MDTAQVKKTIENSITMVVNIYESFLENACDFSPSLFIMVFKAQARL